MLDDGAHRHMRLQRRAKGAGETLTPTPSPREGARIPSKFTVCGLNILLLHAMCTRNEPEYTISRRKNSKHFLGKGLNPAVSPLSRPCALSP